MGLTVEQQKAVARQMAGRYRRASKKTKKVRLSRSTCGGPAAPAITRPGCCGAGASRSGTVTMGSRSKSWSASVADAATRGGLRCPDRRRADQAVASLP